MDQDIRIEVRGFQAIKHASLLIKGITMVQGTTNHGKSSLMRAIESPLFLNPGTEFINHDESKAVVGIDFPKEEDLERLVLVWEKTRTASASYVINGIPATKTGRKGPSDILEGYGIKEIRVRQMRERLMFWRQLESPFLVFLTPSQIFEYVSKLMENRQLVPVLAQMVSDSKELKEKMVSLEGAIGAHKSSLVESKKRYEKLVKIREKESQFLEMRKLTAAYEDLLKIESDIAESEKQKCRAEEEETELANLLSNVDKSGYEGIEKLISSLNSLRPLEEEIASNAEMLLAAETEEVLNAEIVLSFDQLPKREELEKLSDLLKIRDEIVDASSKVLDAEDLERSIEEKIKLAADEISKFEKEVGVCPACGRPY